MACSWWREEGEDQKGQGGKKHHEKTRRNVAFGVPVDFPKPVGTKQGNRRALGSRNCPSLHTLPWVSPSAATWIPSKIRRLVGVFKAVKWKKLFLNSAAAKLCIKIPYIVFFWPTPCKSRWLSWLGMCSEMANFWMHWRDYWRRRMINSY